MSKVQLRTVKVGDNRYIRKEDVANYLEELGGSEETDTRNRLNEAAERIKKLGDNNS